MREVFDDAELRIIDFLIADERRWDSFRRKAIYVLFFPSEEMAQARSSGWPAAVAIGFSDDSSGVRA
jgi:hypothetical protein